MTPRLAPTDEDAIVTAADRRASARRQLDAEALVAARVAELGANNGWRRPAEIAPGIRCRWQRENPTRFARRFYLIQETPDGDRPIAELAWVAGDLEAGTAQFWARTSRVKSQLVPTSFLPEAMVWVEQQIG